MSGKTPNKWEVGGVHSDGGFTEIPELVTGVPDVAEGEVFGSAGADHLCNTKLVLCQRIGNWVERDRGRWRTYDDKTH